MSHVLISRLVLNEMMVMGVPGHRLGRVVHVRHGRRDFIRAFVAIFVIFPVSAASLALKVCGPFVLMWCASVLRRSVVVEAQRRSGLRIGTERASR